MSEDNEVHIIYDGHMVSIESTRGKPYFRKIEYNYLLEHMSYSNIPFIQNVFFVCLFSVLSVSCLFLANSLNSFFNYVFVPVVIALFFRLYELFWKKNNSGLLLIDENDGLNSDSYLPLSRTEYYLILDALDLEE